MRSSHVRTLLILIAACLLTACGSSAKRSEAPPADRLPPPRVTCESCAAAACPREPIDTGTAATVWQEELEDWTVMLAEAYHRCRECAVEHEACLAQHRARGDIR